MDIKDRMVLHYTDIYKMDDNGRIRLDVEKIIFGEAVFKLSEGGYSDELGFFLDLGKLAVFIPVHTRIGEFLEKVYYMVKNKKFTLYISYKGKDKEDSPVYDVDYILD